MDTRRQQYLDAMGISVWHRRGSTVGEAGEADAVDGVPPDAGQVEARWRRLEEQVAGCTACDLHTSRTQTVFGVGSQQASWLVVGEAPGADEDRQGEPFVGRAGRLLNAMLKAVGLSREEVYIANVLKCRPPNNRDPRPEEVAHCEAYLQRQIELLQPRLILVVGRIAAQNLLHSTLSLGRMRGRIHEYGQQRTPVAVTYHPAYLLRTPLDKRKAWQDLCMARELAGRDSS